MYTSKKSKNKTYRTKFSLQSFFQAYAKALQAKAISFEHPFWELKLIHDLLKCLVKESRIAGYQIFKEKQKIQIFLSYDLVQKTPLICRFVFYSSQGRTQISSLKTLQNLKKQSSITLTLISTPLGVLTLKDCLQKKCGGQLLVSIV